MKRNRLASIALAVVIVLSTLIIVGIAEETNQTLTNETSTPEITPTPTPVITPIITPAPATPTEERNSELDQLFDCDQ